MNPPIVARYIKIHPKTWQGFIALRVELYGCRKGKTFRYELLPKTTVVVANKGQLSIASFASRCTCNQMLVTHKCFPWPNRLLFCFNYHAC